ncbi:MAG: prolyl oligopeptidase family serine peptidase, partial [Lachnospiraceae bacterium]
DATKEELEYMSLEKQVNKKTPPVFLWQTISDGAVPVQNSYLMAQACLEAGVPFAHHVFPRGQHGLSLANELWASGNYGGGYTVEQWADFIMDSVQNGRELPLSLNITGRNLTRGELIAKYMEGIQNRKPQPIPEVQIWPQLVQEFLYVCYHNVHSNQ